ncbi:MAG: MFS transporter, partial [Oscillospiraceae bacterium]|nr:MFS transporter [Oscillospiraceae bacterium]
MPNYNRTRAACYIGYVCQAVVVNLMPVLFLPLRTAYGLSYAQFGTLVLLNFTAQVGIDILCSRAVEKHGMRHFVLCAQLCCCAGLLLLAAVPQLFGSHIFVGLLLATMLYAAGGGLLELCLSPIIDAIPARTENPAREMAMLHAVYAWGQVAVVLITTLLLAAKIPWQWIVLIWTPLPLCNFVVFWNAPISVRVAAEDATPIASLLKNKIFLCAVVAIIFGGASEQTMAQYASSFLEEAAELPKAVGDIVGLCGFAL